MALLLPIAGCVFMPEHAGLAAAGPKFAPKVFFAGRTIGEGSLRVDFSHARRVHVDGYGRIGPDGTLILVQHVEQQGSPARMRTWRLRRRADGGFDAALSDAVGPVDVEEHDNLLHVRFVMKGGLGVEQWLYLQSDGRSALNLMVVRKFSIPVAVLRETIRKIGCASNADPATCDRFGGLPVPDMMGTDPAVLRSGGADQGVGHGRRHAQVLARLP